MFRGSKRDALRDNAASGKDLALALSRDKKFRKQLLAAVGHGAAAKRRAAKRVGLTAAAARLAADEDLRRELATMTKNLQEAWSRVEKKRSHKLRNTMMIILGGGAVAAAGYKFRDRVGMDRLRGAKTAAGVNTIDESIEVDVPVSTAYNQWTQFEDFPLFMDGVDDIKQLGDTRLHWVATIAGRTAEWDAKILEQHPDRQISWISEDGKKTRGTVTFEPRGESKTLIRLSMSYKADGPIESLGSTAGLDRQRIRGDLQRFKELIETRGTESGAWRGEVSAGTTDSQG
ncbi:MAG TPA: SRPBCC family protein [Gaiellaceae bacterium]|nr:SRPBCC family protein [Gaiellaceae bacterium]